MGESLAPLFAGLTFEDAATSEASGYALLGEIDFTHPLFVPFASPRYSDFTKIHFWKHRPMTLSPDAAAKVLARFDNRRPALIEQTLGSGRAVLFASGWQPADSQLALSTKFVPLVQGLVDLACGGQGQTANLTIGESLPLAERAAQQPAAVLKPNGQQVQLSADAVRFEETDLPGLYRLQIGDEAYRFAANLASAESNTAPLEAAQLEQLGVRLAHRLTRAEQAEQLRQQRDLELESRQQVWRLADCGGVDGNYFRNLAGRLDGAAHQANDRGFRMIDLRLSRQLAPVGNRFRRLCLWRNLAVAWLLAAALSLGLLALGDKTGLPLKQSMILVGAAAFAAATIAAWRSLAAGRDAHWVAEQVEAEFPELKACLLTAVEQRPELPDGRYGFLQERVIRQAIGHGDRHVWQQAIPTRRLNGARLANFATFCLLCAALAGLALRDRASASSVAPVRAKGAWLQPTPSPSPSNPAIRKSNAARACSSWLASKVRHRPKLRSFINRRAASRTA